MKRKNLYFFAILSMLLIACGKQQEPKPLEITNKLNTENVVNRNMAGEVQDEVTPSIVRIEADDLIGSGVIFAETQEGLIIVTAGHVVNNTENIIITFVDGTKIEPNRVVISNQVDVAFLEVDVQAVNTKVYKRVNIDKNTSDHLEITDRIIVVGSTNEVASQAYEGWILEPYIYMSDFSCHMLWGQTYAMPGMSGGGVFSVDGTFIGILCGGNEENQIAVLPLNIINAEFTIY